MTSIIPPSTNLRQQCRWHPYENATSLALAATQTIMTAANNSITQRACFNIVLAGGNTPKLIYELLKEQNTNWHAWHIYFGDERCLPSDHPERNSYMATQTWLSHVDIPQNQIHLIPTEKGADTAAKLYADDCKNIILFDFVILGLGEDGHTASLFPNHDWGTTLDAPATISVYDAPKSPPQRVTLSARRLSLSRQVLFLVTGNSKKDAISNWQKGEKIPATSITPESGVDIYLEQNLLTEYQE